MTYKMDNDIQNMYTIIVLFSYFILCHSDLEYTIVEAYNLFFLVIGLSLFE